MSDHIEVNGKTYYEASYLALANNNAERRGERIAALEAALKTTLAELQSIQSAAALAGLPPKAWAGFGGAAKKALAAAPGPQEPPKVTAEQFLLHYYGKRCRDYDEGCVVCRSWAEYDKLTAAPKQEPCDNPECPIGCPDSHADIYTPDFKCGTFAPRDAEVEICGQACPFPTLYQGVTQYGLCFKQKGHDGAHETRVAHASVKWIGSTYLRRHAGPQEPPSDGVSIIAAERRRQTEVEGWTPEHDDEHVLAELVRAANVYARLAAKQACDPNASLGNYPDGWPWNFAWWKPSSDPARNLAKAGALIAAEIDRLKRAQEARDAR